MKFTDEEKRDLLRQTAELTKLLGKARRPRGQTGREVMIDQRAKLRLDTWARAQGMSGFAALKLAVNSFLDVEDEKAAQSA